MENILENNRLIAEFMGLKKDNPNSGWFYDNYCKYIKENELEYHSEWNWIMPVVEKIEALDEKSFETTSHFNGFINKRLYNTAFINSKNYEVISSGNLMESRIESVYIAILSFIKHYNNQN